MGNVMANSLGREIKIGEIVVLSADGFSADYKDLKWRLFRVGGGFGHSNITSGTALFGTHIEDGEEARWSGWDIDPVETAAYQAEHPEATADVMAITHVESGPELHPDASE